MIVWIAVYAGACDVYAETKQNDMKGTISVSGTSSESYPPETAEIVFEIENTALTVSSVTAENRKKARDVIDILHGMINEDSGDAIKTSSYSLQPVYEYDRLKKENKFVGYRAVYQITVRTRQIKKVGEFIDRAVKEGVNRILKVGFIISDDTEYCRPLIKKAAEQARAEAEAAADALNVRILGLKEASVSCGSESQPPVYRFGAAQKELRMSGEPTPVEEGAILLRGTANTVFFTSPK